MVYFVRVDFFLDSFAQVKFPSSFSREDKHDHGESMKNILSALLIVWKCEYDCFLNYFTILGKLRGRNCISIESWGG